MLKNSMDLIINLLDTFDYNFVCTYQMNQKIISIKSNKESCIKWANKFFKHFFNIVCHIQCYNHSQIFACFVSKLPVIKRKEKEYEKCKLYLNHIGFTNTGINNIYILPQKYIHYFDGKDHRLILSENFYDNIRVPSRLLREILINENSIDYLRIHAACVTYNSQAYLIIGAKDSGKSTMLCNLLFSKAKFCSNDRTLIFHENNNIYSFGLPVSVRLNKKMIECFPNFNKTNLDQLAFRDINEYIADKIEFTPNELAKLFDTEIEHNMEVRGIIVPDFKKGSKLSVDILNYKKNILYSNLLMPDPAFPQYYVSKHKQFNNHRILEKLNLLPWIKISGDFYGINIDYIENKFKEICCE